MLRIGYEKNLDISFSLRYPVRFTALHPYNHCRMKRAFCVQSVQLLAIHPWVGAIADGRFTRPHHHSACTLCNSLRSPPGQPVPTCREEGQGWSIPNRSACNLCNSKCSAHAISPSKGDSRAQRGRGMLPRNSNSLKITRSLCKVCNLRSVHLLATTRN